MMTTASTSLPPIDYSVAEKEDTTATTAHNITSSSSLFPTLRLNEDVISHSLSDATTTVGSLLFGQSIMILATHEMQKTADRNGISAVFPTLKQLLTDTLMKSVTTKGFRRRSHSSSHKLGGGGGENDSAEEEEEEVITVAKYLLGVDIAVAIFVAQTTSPTEVKQLFRVRDTAKEVIDAELRAHCGGGAADDNNDGVHDGGGSLCSSVLFSRLIVNRYSRSIVTHPLLLHCDRSKRDTAAATPHQQQQQLSSKLGSVVKRLIQFDVNKMFTFPFLSYPYLEKVTDPIDLSTIARRVEEEGYYVNHQTLVSSPSSEDATVGVITSSLIADVELIVDNCILYHGPASRLSQDACALRAQLGPLLKEEGI